jgi:Sulfotransferase family
MLTRRQEQELSEIRSLALELDQSVKASRDDLERLRETRPGDEVPNRGNGNNAGPLAFVHIPKTAGGTVTTMFAAAYSKSEVHKAGNFMRGPEKTEKKVDNWHRRGGRVSVGHVPYGVFCKHLPPDTRYMTFLREPVDRVLSHYHRHIHRQDPRRAGRQAPEPWSPEQGRVKADSLEQAILEMRLPQLRNLATRFLCGDDALTGDLSEAALDSARENLRTFAFIGIQEQFETSVDRLRAILGLGPVPYQNRHVADDRPTVDDLSDDERALIVEHNRLDAELYQFGLSLFEERVAAAAQ